MKEKFAANETPEGNGGAILVADDVEANREMLAAMLEPQGYRVIRAGDGEEALRAVQRGGVNLVLSDVVMPRVNGFGVCRALKSDAQTRLIPVVLITGLSDKEDRIKGIEAGADDFLSKPVHREELLARVRSLLRLKQFTDELENAETVLCTLALSIEAKDKYTEGHCERLAAYSVALGRRLRLPEELLVALRRGGIVHDIGKVAVPEHILLKPGSLTPEERRIMEQHPLTGERICAPLKSFRHVLPIIRHHHERPNGTGYPDGLKNGEIPLTASILQTVDVFDALSTDRPYRAAMTAAAALARMYEEVRFGWLEGDLVRELESLLAENQMPAMDKRLPHSEIPAHPAQRLAGQVS
jgi:putative two-component system response regulator